MDCRTGEIYSASGMQKIKKDELKHFVPLTPKLARDLRPLGAEKRKNFMRNKPCICDSGKKFKKCCWSKYE